MSQKPERNCFAALSSLTPHLDTVTMECGGKRSATPLWIRLRVMVQKRRRRAGTARPTFDPLPIWATLHKDALQPYSPKDKIKQCVRPSARGKEAEKLALPLRKTLTGKAMFS